MRSNSEQNTIKNSLIPYYLASSGQLSQLDDYLRKHPDILNKGWDGDLNEYNDKGYGTPLINNATQTIMCSSYSSAIFCLALISSSVTPLFFLGLGAASLFGGISGAIALESGYVKNRKGRTLLDFAAETGQTEIALFLLSKGAYLKNSLEIAAEYKRYNFITIISNECEKIGKNKQLVNKINEMQQVITNLTDDMASHNLNTPIHKFDLNNCNELIKSQMATINLLMDKFDPEKDLEDILDINQKNHELGTAYNIKYAERLESTINDVTARLNDSNKTEGLEIIAKLKSTYKEHCEKSDIPIKQNPNRNPNRMLMRNRNTNPNRMFTHKPTHPQENRNPRNPTEWYTCNDILRCVQTSIRSELGGLKNNHCFLLENQYQENGKNYSVAVLSPLDEELAIEYYFDVDFQPMGFPRYDLFNDIVDLIISNEYQNIKVLSAFNLQNHWITVETLITKIENNFKLEIIAHDPFGGSGHSFSNEHYQKLANVMKKQIVQLNSYAIVESFHLPSPYNNPRQQDVYSCGVITVEDILKRSRGESLNRVQPYPVGTTELRNDQWDKVEHAQNNRRRNAL